VLVSLPIVGITVTSVFIEAVVVSATPTVVVLLSVDAVLLKVEVVLLDAEGGAILGTELLTAPPPPPPP
jgi:hypothetical protein